MEYQFENGNYLTIKDYLNYKRKEQISKFNGYVYVLKCEYKFKTLVKVGKSTNYLSRLNGHKTSNPLIEYVTHFECDMSAELYVHSKLKDHLEEGCTEWFVYYEGIFEDIEKWINEYKRNFDEEVFIREFKHLFVDRREVCKLKCKYNTGFMFLVTDLYNHKSLTWFVKQNYGLNVEVVEWKPLKSVDINYVLTTCDPYVIFNNITQKPKYPDKKYYKRRGRRPISGKDFLQMS